MNQRDGHRVVTEFMADRLRVPQPSVGIRVWSDDHEAGFFMHTALGPALVTVKLMQSPRLDPVYDTTQAHCAHVLEGNFSEPDRNASQRRMG